MVFTFKSFLNRKTALLANFGLKPIKSEAKLNSNPYHYKLKFISTSKQKYNSKFQEFETVWTLKIQKKRPNLDQKPFLFTIIFYVGGCV